MKANTIIYVKIISYTHNLWCFSNNGATRFEGKELNRNRMIDKDRCIPSCACSSSWCCTGNTTTLLSRTLPNSNRYLYIFDRLHEANDCWGGKKICNTTTFTFCNIDYLVSRWTKRNLKNSKFLFCTWMKVIKSKVTAYLYSGERLSSSRLLVQPCRFHLCIRSKSFHYLLSYLWR